MKGLRNRTRRRQLLLDYVPEAGSADEGGPWHYLGEPGEPTVNSPWNQIGTNGAFRKRGAVVDLRGTFIGGTAGSTLFTLPVGFRPDADANPVASVIVDIGTGLNLFTGLTIQSDGDVIAPSFGPGGTYTLISLAFEMPLVPATAP